MDFHRLRCFVTVIETGSLSRAAIALNMTQPPLSMLIRKLEHELGVSLFERLGKKLVPTDTGTLLYTRARSLLASVGELTNELKECNAGIRGTVVVGCSTAASLFIIPKVMKRLREETPNIVVRIREGESSYLAREIRDQKLDAGIFRTGVVGEDLQTETLFVEPIYLAVSSDHRLANRESVEIVELSEETFLLHATSFGQGISEVILEACHLSGFAPNVAYWGSETLPMLLMVQEGLGVSFAPESFRRIEGPMMPRFVRVNHPNFTTKLNLITLKNRFRTAVARRFLEVTSQVIEDMQRSVIV